MLHRNSLLVSLGSLYTLEKYLSFKGKAQLPFFLSKTQPLHLSKGKFLSSASFISSQAACYVRWDRFSPRGQNSSLVSIMSCHGHQWSFFDKNADCLGLVALK